MDNIPFEILTEQDHDAALDMIHEMLFIKPIELDTPDGQALHSLISATCFYEEKMWGFQ